MNAIDLFAGAGGFSTGATMAGCTVVWAANHWPAAVQVHANNHPGAVHVCQDLQQADWTRVPAHDLLLASPACQGHSRARGKERAHHDAQRSTAWAVVSAAECHRPAVVLIENVPEFAAWVLYPAWCAAMHALGYALAPMVLDAADHGVAQHRRRLFVVATRSKHPIELHLPRLAHVGSASIIDFGAGRWQPIHKPGRAAAASMMLSTAAPPTQKRAKDPLLGNAPKVGRMKITDYVGRYAGYSLSEWSYDKDLMPVGSFRLVHAYSDGGRRYAYNVTPDTAAWVAAATLAVHAMTEAIHKANQFTRLQRQAVDKEAASRYRAGQCHLGSRRNLERARMDDSSGARRGAGGH
jgi:site-specific DNA-cytosine methylase